MIPRRCDVVVIGAGVAGLTAALSLVRDGRSVVVLERQHQVGGYCSGFRRRGYVFDAAVHHLSAAAPRANLGLLLRRLGIQLPLHAVEPVDTVVFPDEEVPLPSGFLELRQALAHRYPGETANLKALFRRMRTLYRDIRRGRWEGEDEPYDVFLRRYLSHPKAIRALGAQWGYLGLPPERLSARGAVMAIGSYLLEGAALVEGGCFRLSQELVRAFREGGGHLALRTPAQAICWDGGRVHSVAVERGEIACSAVVAAMDTAAVARELLSPALGEEERRPWVEGELSTSAYMLYLGLRRGVELSRLSRGFYFGPTVPGDWACVAQPTAVDPSLAPGGGHVLSVMVPAPAEELPPPRWRERKGTMEEALRAFLRTRCPAIDDAVEVSVMASPGTMARYTGNRGGAIYGWAMTPEQTGPGRLGPLTPIEGLALAGHWTSPGPGIHGVAVSGAQAAALISPILDRGAAMGRG